MEHKVTPRRTYLFVYLALMVLLVATVAAGFIDLGFLNLILTVSIAVAKAVLVILFFMHVRNSSQVTKLYVIAGFVWLVILVGLTFSDYLTRTGVFLAE